MSKNRIVIAKFANGGIGDHLSCLIGAWWFAKRTGRQLIIDWRGSRFNSDTSHNKNCFTDFFGHYKTLYGVDVICDDSTNNIQFSGPFFPDKWNSANLSGTQHVKHTSEEIANVNALVTSDKDCQEPTVAFNQWISPPPPKTEVRLMLKELQFAKPILNSADKIWSTFVGSNQAIAIHIRHGNGENIGFRASYWLDPIRYFKQLRLNLNIDVHRSGSHGKFNDNMPDSLIQTQNFTGSELSYIKRIIATAYEMQRNIPNAKIILFCDSEEVTKCFKLHMPEIIIPPKKFLAADQGPLHSFNSGGTQASSAEIFQSGFEMATEMELMRRCSALIYMDSGFSIFSQICLDDQNKVLLKPKLINKLVEKFYLKLRGA